jgi:hypothetical protein
MGISKPYHRNYRAFVQGTLNWEYSQWAYIVDHGYATAPMYYTRIFLFLQKDIQQLFEFVEPSDTNLSTYSYRIHQLFIRTCIEIEANFKAIFKDNKYSKPENKWTINDYKKINKTHHLDAYEATFPLWDGDKKCFTPFKSWAEEHGTLQWYKDYNLTKHNRQGERKLANMNNLLNAFSALFILLSSQFKNETFDTGDCLLSCGTSDTYYKDCEFGIGEYLLIKYPNNWEEDEKYDFNWADLKKESDKFQKFDYDT